MMKMAQKRRSSKPRAGSPLSAGRFAFIATTLLLVSGFLMAGGGRDDLLSLLVWRPLSMIFLALAIALHFGDAWRNGRALMLFALAVMLLPALQLIPLPPSLWSSLPGRELIAAIYRDAGMALPWQPFSLAQARTWNALFSLAAPLAMLVLALSVDMQSHRRILLILIGLGFVSGILGMLQALGSANGPLYFYRITNNGLSVGLFANRNHQAAFLATMFPLIAAQLSFFKGKPEQLSFQRALAVVAGLMLLLLILMTGSRAGIVLAVFGIASSWWVYRRPVAKERAAERGNEHRTRMIGFGLTALLFVFAAIVAARTPAVERLLETDSTDELRVTSLPIVMKAVEEFSPLGSGLGTFVETYQIFEPNKLVGPTYFNHAHNDFLEILMTAGIPGVALIIWAALLGLWALRSQVRLRGLSQDEPGFQAQVLGRTGLSIIAMLALNSAADYPLRVPSLMLLAAVAAGWCSNAHRAAQR